MLELSVNTPWAWTSTETPHILTSLGLPGGMAFSVRSLYLLRIPVEFSLWIWPPPMTRASQVVPVKNLPANARAGRECRRSGFDPWDGKLPWSRKWQATSVFLLGISHGQEKHGGLQSMGFQKVGHNWATEYTHISLCPSKWGTFSMPQTPRLVSNFAGTMLGSFPKMGYKGKESEKFIYIYIYIN